MNTSIYEQLEALYKGSSREAGALQADIEYYLRTGYVFNTPEFFIMGCRISNGWYIHAAVGIGAIEGFLRFMPYHLEYIGWERRGSGKTKWYSTEKLKQRLLRGKHESKSTASSSTSTSSSTNAG